MKALEILNKIYTDDGRYLCVEHPVTYDDVYRAIVELEYVLKPKSCDACAYFNNAIAGLGQYCFVLERQVGEKFYCSEYVPNDNK